MAEDRNNRSKKKRKKRLKKRVKIALLIICAVILGGVSIGYKYYLNRVERATKGTISNKPPESSNAENDGYQLKNDNESADYWILDAGNGEAIYIQIGDSDVLIDTGTKSTAKSITKTVEGNIRGKLDYVILTNGATGRIGGCKELYKNVAVDHTIIGDLGNKDKDIRKIIGDNGDIINGESTTLELDKGATLSIFKPEVASKDSRDQSLMTLFTYGDSKFVAESDAGPEEEAKLLNALDSCDVLVLGRHGSADTNQVSLNERYTVVSTGKGSGLPAKKLVQKKQAIFSTAKSGTIKFSTDSALVDTTLNTINDAVKSD